MNCSLPPPSSIFLIWGVRFDVVVRWPFSPSPLLHLSPPFLSAPHPPPPRCLSRLSDMVWVLDVVTCWKILTDGFHNDKKIHSPVGLKKEKKKKLYDGCFFLVGGWPSHFSKHPPSKKKKNPEKEKKNLAAEMFLICCACFSLTRFVVEDCRRFWCSKKSVN